MERIITQTKGDKVIQKLEITREIKQVISKEDILKRRQQAQTFIVSQQQVISECDSQLAQFSE